MTTPKSSILHSVAIEFQVLLTMFIIFQFALPLFLNNDSVLFRDIKPADIGISFDDVPQVFDFGLATE